MGFEKINIRNKFAIPTSPTELAIDALGREPSPPFPPSAPPLSTTIRALVYIYIRALEGGCVCTEGVYVEESI
jgi:hypothetical protein